MKNKGRPKGQKSKKIVFENERYQIAEIPLNYMIKVKIKKILGEFIYSDLERGLDYAKETAEYLISKYSKF